MKKQITFLKNISCILLCSMLITSCNSSDESLNEFTVQNEINLGKILRDDVARDTTNFPILKESNYPLAYSRLNAVKDDILLTNLLTFDERFDWQLRIIQNDNVIQAFTLPGGYLYIYTGMLKSLATEDQLAGLIAYEMAQTESRVLTENLINKYSQTLIIALANNDEQSIQSEALTSISTDLTELGISDEEVTQIETLAVNYLNNIGYSCDGLTDLFEVLNQNSNDEILWVKVNTNLESRKLRVQTYAQSINCEASASTNDYSEIKNSLP